LAVVAAVVVHSQLELLEGLEAAVKAVRALLQAVLAQRVKALLEELVMAMLLGAVAVLVVLVFLQQGHKVVQAAQE
jgi:hypothetical protein